MEERTVKYVKILGTILVIGGFLAMIGGINYNPDIKVEYEGEFNQTYAENHTSTPIFRSRLETTNKTISPSDVHNVVDTSNLTDDTTSKINDIIETNNTTAIVGRTEGLVLGKNIVRNEDNENHIVKASLNSQYSPMQIIFVGLSTFFLGIYVLLRISNSGIELPNDIEKSEDSRWEYDYKD